MTGAVCEAQEKTTVGVLRIQCNSNEISNILTDALTTDLAKIKSFNVVERNALDQVFSEQALSADGIVEKLQDGSGSAMGLQYVLIGSADANMTRQYNSDTHKYDYHNNVVVNLKLIDAYNQIGQIIWSGQRTVENYNEDIVATANEAAYDMARQLYDVFPVQGYVLKLSQQKIYIDLGSLNGMKKGDKLVVEGIKDTIIHPITGKKIVTKDVVGKLKVGDVFDDFCTAEFDGDSFKLYAGDVVKRQLRGKPHGFLGLGWSGNHEF